MKLLKVKAQSPGRVLNIWNTAYIFDKNAECTIPESDTKWLPALYKVIWEVENTKEIIPEEEIKKVVAPKKDIKKVKNEDLEVKKAKGKTKADEVKK